MDLEKVIKRHKELETSINEAVSGLTEKPNLNMGSLMSLVSGKKFDLSSLGLPSDLLEQLSEYQKLSASLRKVGELVLKSKGVKHA